MMSEKEKIKSTFWSGVFPSKVSNEEYDQLKDNNAPPPELGIGFSNSKWIIAAGLLVIALFFGVGGFFVYSTDINGAVVAPGVIKAEAERQTVQHLEGGIVKEILVKEGDHVVKGQPILVLQSSLILGSVDQLRNQLYAKQLAAARLRAEKYSSAKIIWPNELLDSSGRPRSSDIAILMGSEQKIFLSKQQNFQSQVDLLSKQIEQISKEIDNFRQQGLTAKEISQSLTDELRVKQRLSNERFIDNSIVLGLQRNLAEAEGRRAMLKGAVAENQSKISELKIRINGLRNNFTEQAEAEFGQINTQLLDLRDRLQPLDDARTRLTVIAPITGQIVSTNIHLSGGVLPPGGKILDILPENSAMVVEVPIQVRDITKITLGQMVKVRLSAFNNKTLKKVIGHVTYISADREERRSAYGMQPFYVVHVSLDSDDLRRKNLYISAGMPAMAFFLSKPRKILDYAMEPLSQNFAKAYGGEDRRPTDQ